MDTNILPALIDENSNPHYALFALVFRYGYRAIQASLDWWFSIGFLVTRRILVIGVGALLILVFHQARESATVTRRSLVTPLESSCLWFRVVPPYLQNSRFTIPSPFLPPPLGLEGLWQKVVCYGEPFQFILPMFRHFFTLCVFKSKGVIFSQCVLWVFEPL